LALALAFAASTAAYAFQEIQQGTQPGTPSAQQNGGQPPLELQIPSLDKSTPTGTEVRIPGLGKLGVLPKLDFGLELLYGAAEGKQAPALPNMPQDDLTIRGAIKHKF